MGYKKELPKGVENAIPLGYSHCMQKIHEWLKSERGRAAKLAKHLGVGVPMVWKMAKGERPVPHAHGAKIEAFTQGEVSRRDMWPTTWQDIWPELAAPSNPPAAQG